MDLFPKYKVFWLSRFRVCSGPHSNIGPEREVFFWCFHLASVLKLHVEERNTGWVVRIVNKPSADLFE